MQLSELKVIDTDDPILILGCDMMAPGQPSTWEWESIGLDGQTKQGKLVFVDELENGTSATEQVNLVCWPQKHDKWVPSVIR